MAGVLSMLGIGGGSGSGGAQQPATESSGIAQTKPAVLLVIQADADYDWPGLFGGKTLRDGRPIRVVQAGWSDLLVTADAPPSTTPLLVHIRPQSGSTPGQTVRPDFVLVRNETRDATGEQDARNALFGLMFADVPAVNSLQSIYMFLERPIVQGELNKLVRRHGRERFPVICQSYFADHRTMMYGGSFPAVLKLGHAHAGFGKMRVADHHDWEDVRSVVAMTGGKYCTAEPFLEGDYDLRIQKIGPHVRVLKRTAMAGQWKTNTGCSVAEDIPVTPQYQFWAEAAAEMFGGLDICTVDVLHEASTGRELILEVNGTSSGLCPEHALEDNQHICELTLERMNERLCAPE
eukprot:SAG31_NODE_1802_length_7238_cov_3.417285_6_plen_349_part_00